jgi:hypothetical protein
MASNVTVPNHLNLFQIVEVKGRKKPVWNRAGVGFINRDGSINVTVDALPGCKFQLREPLPREPEAAPAKGRNYKIDRSKKNRR